MAFLVIFDYSSTSPIHTLVTLQGATYSSVVSRSVSYIEPETFRPLDDRSSICATAAPNVQN